MIKVFLANSEQKTMPQRTREGQRVPDSARDESANTKIVDSSPFAVFGTTRGEVGPPCGTLWHPVAPCGTLWQDVAPCGIPTLWHSGILAVWHSGILALYGILTTNSGCPFHEQGIPRK